LSRQLPVVRVSKGPRCVLAVRPTHEDNQFNMKPTRLDNLTAARFVAAMLVVFHHATSVLQDPNIITHAWLRSFFNNGYVGVTFFFILSGFVISASSFNQLQTPHIRNVLDFLARRLIRVVPVWLLLSLPLIFPAIEARPIPVSLYEFLSFTQAWSADVNVSYGYLAVAWTLSCEMFFYAMFPLAAFVIGRLRQRFRYTDAAVVSLAILVPFCGYLLFVYSPTLASLSLMDPNGPHRWLYRNPAMRFSEFLLGIGLFLYFERYRARSRQTYSPWIWPGVLLVSASALLLLMANLSMNTFSLAFAYIIPFGLIVFSLAAMEVGDTPIAVNAPLLLLLGEASYSLYLVHHHYGLPLFTPAFGAEKPLAGLVWGIVLVLALSVGIYMLIEKPMRTLLTGWLERIGLRPRERSVGAV